jgi:hypothetical protein
VNITDITMRWATRSVRPVTVAGLALAALGVSACGSATARQSQSPSYPVIVALESASGVKGDSPLFSTQPLASDVITFIKSQNRFSIFQDLGRVTMRIAMRDVTNPNDPTTNNTITFRRYRVVYKRSDGRNTPGVDVPYAFDAGTTFSVLPGIETRAVFELVRIQAKEEAPLLQLRTGGTAIDISCFAEVTFYGEDQQGREVTAVGLISVDFANWGDPDL